MSDQSSLAAEPKNSFLRGSIRSVFIRTCLPIIVVTTISGLLTVVDAMLLGAFVGADALSAVTLVFPISMLLVAVSTMVGIGMASILGRRLGAQDMDGAINTFASAQGLAVAVAALAMLTFFGLGVHIVSLVAGGNVHLGEMGWTFLAISFSTAPAGFLLSVHADALRMEGRVGFMAMAGVLVTLANIGFNGLLIGVFDFGVAGSAWGTALAQVLGLGIVVVYRMSSRAVLPMVGLRYDREWREMLTLGAPRSLNFIGISLSSAAVLYALQRLELPQSDMTIAAYGVVMRLMTFAFLPLMGMSLALQAIVGNTVGAGQDERTKQTLYFSLGVSVVYGLLVQLLLLGGRDWLGGLFVPDALVRLEVARIVPLYLAAYFAFGPVMMAASYAQAIGRAREAAILSLGRAYLFAIPLTFALPYIWGETGVWIAAPMADILMLTLSVLVWWRAGIYTSRKAGHLGSNSLTP
ncbi:putative MATE family efflux protein [Aminobacter niigataensis]|uniref:Multidrug export protein MepA n=1 Tax=Aminobacter niigataensis TaxID=83265 RepID=A0ABR6L186_9HYPH|nr:MATE family efflux transporter [Aminobacter niigataensis]MBB4650528.1 putative MATE family efflux protein [Aminobacter niigataensis]